MIRAAVLALALLGAAASPSDARPLRGVYRFVGGDAERARANAAIDLAIADLDPLRRAWARARLVDALAVAERLELDVDEDVVAVAAQGRPTARSPADGTPAPLPGDDDVVLRQTRTGDRVVQVFVGAEATRTNVFELHDGDRRLRLHVALEARALKKPVRFALSYARSGP